MNDQHDCATGLTCREYQVLELVAQGYSAKEVAQRIDIAPRTVERHIDNVRLKLQARNRTHMVAKAIAANLLTPDGRQAMSPFREPAIVHPTHANGYDLFGLPAEGAFNSIEFNANGIDRRGASRWH